jgi:DNA-binding NtrC family response regulator
MSLEHILVVDDEPMIQRSLERVLRSRNIKCSLAGSLAAANTLMASAGAFDMIMLDVQLPDGNGHRFLEQIVALPNHPLVVMITGHGTIESAVTCMRAGAFDYLIKPFQPSQFDLLLRKADNYSQLVKVNQYLNVRENRDGSEEIIGRSPAMLKLRQLVDRVAPTEATVLIMGEHGSGKEKVAQDIFKKSPRRDRPYIKVNCAALSEQLIESELFGHEKGAYTGATERREGRFELANRGTILLDEVSELPLNLQAKLLRVLQEREFERVGGSKTIRVNVRILATSNRDLEDFVARGLFRADLYYRLNVFPIQVPPLRDRGEDIELFAESFLRRFSRKHGLLITGYSEHALESLKAYQWPGNVRELENSIERAVILSEENRPITDAALNLPRLQRMAPGRLVAHPGIQPEAFLPLGYAPAAKAPTPIAERPSSVIPVPSQLEPSVPAGEDEAAPAVTSESDAEPVFSDSDGDDGFAVEAGFSASREDEIIPLRDMEKKAILAALLARQGNRTQAANLLGISIRTMRNKLQEYRIEEGITP